MSVQKVLVKQTIYGYIEENVWEDGHLPADIEALMADVPTCLDNPIKVRITIERSEQEA